MDDLFSRPQEFQSLGDDKVTGRQARIDFEFARLISPHLNLAQRHFRGSWIDDPYSRVAGLRRQRRPWQLDLLNGTRMESSGDGRAERHVGCIAKIDLYPDRPGACVDGWRNFPNGSRVLADRIGKKRDRYVPFGSLAEIQGLIDIENRITRSIVSQRKDRLSGLGNLPHLGASFGDDSIGIGTEFGIGKGIPRRIQLRLRRCHASPGCRQCLLRLIEGSACRHLCLEQALLALECKACLDLLGLGRLQVRLGDRDVRPLFFRVDTSKDIAGFDGSPDIHKPLHDLATHPERQLRLHPRPDVTRNRSRPCSRPLGYGDCPDRDWACRLCSFLLLAGGQCGGSHENDAVQGASHAEPLVVNVDPILLTDWKVNEIIQLLNEAEVRTTMAKKLTRAEIKAMRPTQILDAAFEEFIERGFAATRVEDIAARVGVTKGTVYVYFDTKEGLFEAVARHVSVPFEEVLQATHDMEGTAADGLRKFIELLYDQVIDNRETRELLRLVIAEGSRFPALVDKHHEEFVEPLIARLQMIVDAGVASGEFRPGPAAKMADVVAGPALLMLLLQLVFHGRHPVNREDFIQAHLDLVLHGLLTGSKGDCMSP